MSSLLDDVSCIGCRWRFKQADTATRGMQDDLWDVRSRGSHWGRDAELTSAAGHARCAGFRRQEARVG